MGLRFTVAGQPGELVPVTMLAKDKVVVKEVKVGAGGSTTVSLPN